MQHNERETGTDEGRSCVSAAVDSAEEVVITADGVAAGLVHHPITRTSGNRRRGFLE